MMDRRKFLKAALKSSFIFTGLVFMPKTGIYRPSQADAFWWASHNAASGGVSGGTSWSNWDEITEGGWGDSANNLIVIGEAAAAVDNEVGQGGGLTGADLIFTQIGSPAANGTYRTMDGVDDYFTWTINGVSAFIGSRSVYTFVWKFVDYPMLAASYPAVLANGTHYIYPYVNSNLQMYFGDASLATFVATVNNITPTTGVIYIVIWSDGTNIRVGFCATKPTKLSDFAANSVAAINHTSAIATASLTSSYGVGYTSSKPAVKWCYLVASKLCLIDNAS